LATISQPYLRRRSLPSRIDEYSPYPKRAIQYKYKHAEAEGPGIGYEIYSRSLL